MTIDEQFDRDMQDLDEDLEQGSITPALHRQLRRDLVEYYRQTYGEQDEGF